MWQVRPPDPRQLPVLKPAAPLLTCSGEGLTHETLGHDANVSTTLRCRFDTCSRTCTSRTCHLRALQLPGTAHVLRWRPRRPCCPPAARESMHITCLDWYAASARRKERLLQLLLLVAPALSRVRVCIYSIDSNSHSYSHYHHDIWVCVAQLCQIEDPTLPSSQQLIWPCQECLRQRSANACAGSHHVHTANTADTTYPPPVWSRHIGWPPAGCIGVAAECMSSIASLPPELPAKSVHAWGQIRHCAHRYNAAELTTGADQWHAVV